MFTDFLEFDTSENSQTYIRQLRNLQKLSQLMLHMHSNFAACGI